MQYTKEVMDHFLNPHNVGEIENPDGIGEVGNARCGDIMRITLKVSKNFFIEDVKFKTFGCAAAIATSSMATDLIKNKSLKEALTVNNIQIIKKLGGLPELKVHCSVLAQEAIRAAVEDFCKKNKFDICTFIC